MTKPNDAVWKQLAQLSTIQTDLKDYLDSWYMYELQQLPRVTNTTALSQGRCQVLAEITQLFNKAPEIARLVSSR